jgi:hypothetical protein
MHSHTGAWERDKTHLTNLSWLVRLFNEGIAQKTKVSPGKRIVKISTADLSE